MKTDLKNSNLTPMMEQFFRLKKENPGFILFFRMGDFYEMFDEDAKVAAKILGLTLTKRQQFDMCGIPHHAKDNYLYKLIQANQKVAICEQVEIQDNQKKMFDRKVMELLTPGTFHNDQVLKKEQNHFLMSLYKEKQTYYFALADVSTGKLLMGQARDQDSLKTQIYKFQPSEIILSKTQEKDFSDLILERYYSLIELSDFTQVQEEFFKRQFRVESLTALGLDHLASQAVVFANLQYLKNNLFKEIKHINVLERLQNENIMYLNETTIKNLEILDSQSDTDKKQYSLLAHLNITKTLMGARYLRQLIVQPSTNISAIQKRLDLVSFFQQKPPVLDSIRSILNSMPDIERLISKVALKTSTPKDIWSLKNGLMLTEQLKQTLPKNIKSYLIEQDISLHHLITLVEKTLVENPPLEIGDMPTILDSFSEELALLRKKAIQSYQVLIDIEKREQEKNDLPRLRVKYNKILGYYLEIPKGAATKVPEYFIRKQTLSNLERFTIDELIRFEQEVLTAKDNLLLLEKEIFTQLCEQIVEQIQLVQNNIEIIKNVDIYSSFAQIALDHNYVRPEMTLDSELEILEGRHPVVEKYVSIFTSNSLLLDSDDNRLWIISGPNMAGKSTFLRQNALIVLMAHLGCFVPASRARISITDQIFTRIGASDNLAKGESTFLVEMAEASSILNFSTHRSLIIMDEIGRGTSTNDGLSLAWAIVEYLCDPKTNRGKILFATHYHELAKLEKEYVGIKNYRMVVKETDQDIVFLHKIERGSADRSYGIHVAAIAGIPAPIIQRAHQLLLTLSSVENPVQIPRNQVEKKTIEQNSEIENHSLNLSLEKQLAKIDLNRITGLDALNILNQMKKEIKNWNKNQLADESGILF